MRVVESFMNLECRTPFRRVLHGGGDGRARLHRRGRLLGKMLLELNQPARTLKEFEVSHQVDLNRFRSLYGAAQINLPLSVR